MTNYNKIEERFHSVTVPDDFYCSPLNLSAHAGMAHGVETPLQRDQKSVGEKAIEIASKCNDVVSGGSNVPGGEVKHPLVGKSVKDKSEGGPDL